MADVTSDSVYCSTSGTYFKDKDTLTEHYKSDLHRYNLKRKVAGLPPVTKEWFEARKSQLLSTAAGVSSKSVWIDPLTKKKFQSQQTYDTYVASKKYKDLVKKSGKPAPECKVIVKKPKEAVKTEKVAFATKNDSESEWETASDEDAPVGENEEVEEPDLTEEWDVRKCFFDNHISESFETNVEYMFKNFGFFFPEAEHLKDPQGLLKYLGAKLMHGHIPLHRSGLDPQAKRFKSLHAVQRHMIDSNKWTMLFEGNEDEYEDFYDFSFSDDEDEGGDIVLADDVGMTSGGFELVLRDQESGREKVLGTRTFARFYRQKHKLGNTRESVLCGQIVARYRNLGISTKPVVPPEVKKARKQAKRKDYMRLKAELRANVNNNLPRNVPY